MAVLFSTPCFRCFLSDDLKARACHPEACDELTAALSSPPACTPRDQSLHTPPMDTFALEIIPVTTCLHLRQVKNGVRTIHGARVQIYRCKDCRKKVPHVVPGWDRKMKHRREVVEFARKLSLNVDPAFSSRDIAKRVLEVYGERVSHVTIVRWLLL